MQLHLLSSPGEQGIEYVLEVAYALLTSQRSRVVAYLPAASLGRRWVRETKAAFRGLAMVSAIDVETQAFDRIQSILDRAALLYIPGGNTYLLAQRLHHQPQWPGGEGLIAELRQRVLSGLPLIGCSAGAVLCGPDILTTNDINCCGCTTFSGLGLASFNLNPHYPAEPGELRQARDDRLQEYLAFHPKRTVLALEDGAYLKVIDGEVSVERGNVWKINKDSQARALLSVAIDRIDLNDFPCG
jgi:peptidase E